MDLVRAEDLGIGVQAPELGSQADAPDRSEAALLARK